MPTRTERNPLSRGRIIQAAMLVADREGLEAVTMRRVGTELGVEAMSLYRHVPNKEELLKGIHALMLTEVRHHDGPSGDWKERLRVVMRSYRAVCLAHPAVAQLSSKSPPTDVPFLHFEQDLATMSDAGFGAEEAGLALRALLAFTTGFMIRELGSAPSPEAAESEPLTVKAEEYPHLAASYPYLVGSRRSLAFEYGLDRLLEGIERERDRPD